MKQQKPPFEHDCSSCIFLGTVRNTDSLKPIDLYYCLNEPTVIARYSSERYDYVSGLIFSDPDRMEQPIAELYLARLIAKERNLIK